MNCILLRLAGLLSVMTAAMAISSCGGSLQQEPPMPPGPPSITTASLADGTIGSAYSQTIVATGGVLPFTWSVVAGALPHNVTLASSSGSLVMISGMPDRVQSSVTFTIEVRDARNQSATQSYTARIASSPTIAVTQSGPVRGVVVGNLLAFRGIPYAAPPVGDLRWRPPHPPARWNGVRDGSAFGSACPQMSNGVIVGDEDCLTLNVYVGQPPQPKPLPVMVFLHGGANTQGDTRQDPYGTPQLATHGVLVVTVEYRLGLLGFFANAALTAEGGGSSGNYALRDQIAALAWVQQNIAAFGGDPQHVMLFGQSAGANDVHAVVVSPATKGLISAAALESGYVPFFRLYALDQLETLDEPIVSTLGCGGATDVLACLRAVPADTIVSQQRTIVSFRYYAIEPQIIPVDPFVALQNQGSPVPLMLGTNREEFTILGDDPTTPLDEAGYEAAVHAEFDPFGPTVADQVLALYPAAAYDSPMYALIAVDSDSTYACQMRDHARAAAGAGRPPVWRYLFTHRYENDFFLQPLRAFHTAELFFVFDDLAASPTPNGPYTPTPAEVALSGQMIGYWTRFAATGDPNGGGAPPWPPYDATTDPILQLDDTPSVIDGYQNPQCDFFFPFTRLH